MFNRLLFGYKKLLYKLSPTPDPENPILHPNLFSTKIHSSDPPGKGSLCPPSPTPKSIRYTEFVVPYKFQTAEEFLVSEEAQELQAIIEQRARDLPNWVYILSYFVKLS